MVKRGANGGNLLHDPWKGAVFLYHSLDSLNTAYDSGKMMLYR